MMLNKMSKEYNKGMSDLDYCRQETVISLVKKLESNHELLRNIAIDHCEDHSFIEILDESFKENVEKLFETLRKDNIIL